MRLRGLVTVALVMIASGLPATAVPHHAAAAPAAPPARPATAPARPATAPARPATAQGRIDINGDGYPDLVINQDRAARILYGSPTGLSASRSAFFPDDVLTQPLPEDFESSGSTTAAADFDGDGYTDLAVGVPEAQVGRKSSAGAVYVLYGSATGLDPTRRQTWSQDSSGVAGTAEPGDWFGGALAAGDFDGSGDADLAIGVPGEQLRGHRSWPGAVHVLYGSARGLTANRSRWLTSGSPGVPGTLRDKAFGAALAAGDLTASGYDDVVVGVPGARANGRQAAGAVVVLRGGPTGITSKRAQRWTQATKGVHGRAEAGDEFGGGPLVVGHFAGRRYADVAVGVRLERVRGQIQAGAVNVLYGTARGLTSKGNQIWTKASAGISGKPGEYEEFGISLASADLGRNGGTTTYDDLAVGAIWGNGGAVFVLHGSATGLTARGSQRWTLASPGVPEDPDDLDSFGASVAAADFGRGPYADLVIGIPDLIVDGDGSEPERGGGVLLLRSTRDGLTGAGSTIWTNSSFGPDAGAPQLGYGLLAR
ncbi:FG-GAP-like repeat-containing protein [Microlunatus ginsengisoli]